MSVARHTSRPGSNSHHSGSLRQWTARGGMAAAGLVVVVSGVVVGPSLASAHGTGNGGAYPGRLPRRTAGPTSTASTTPKASVTATQGGRGGRQLVDDEQHRRQFDLDQHDVRPHGDDQRGNAAIDCSGTTILVMDSTHDLHVGHLDDGEQDAVHAAEPGCRRRRRQRARGELRRDEGLLRRSEPRQDHDLQRDDGHVDHRPGRRPGDPGRRRQSGERRLLLQRSRRQRRSMSTTRRPRRTSSSAPRSVARAPTATWSSTGRATATTSATTTCSGSRRPPTRRARSSSPSSPPDSRSASDGIAFSGDGYLYTTDRITPGQIKKVNPITGAIVATTIASGPDATAINTDAGSCSSQPGTVSLKKNLPSGRAVAGDQFSLTISRDRHHRR